MRNALAPLRSRALAAFAAPFLLLVLLVGCGGAASDGDDDGNGTVDADTVAYLTPSELSREAVLDSLPMDTIDGHPSWTELDWRILQEATRWAWSRGVHELEVPEAIARLGRHFVGTRYVPFTLEAEGEERLVVNLRALDCVTFIENMMALTWFVRSAEPSILEDRDRAMELYEGFLEDVRYRGGELEGYPSRLHYFTEWLSDNDARGLVRLRTREVGGVPTDERIDFMTENRDSYRQLADPEVWERIGEIERHLSSMERYYVPEDRIAEVADRIETGDIIAATSSIDGLDVAHTGLALWIDGELHLMHAPLVGEDVQISERTLAERIRSIEGQDGIVVARPLPHPSEGERPGAEGVRGSGGGR